MEGSRVPVCPNGHQVPPGAQFCPECGAAIGAEAAGEDRGRRASSPYTPGVIIGGVLLTAVGLTLIFTLGDGGHTIDGSFSLFDKDVGSDCQGSAGYNDIGPGASVTVRNESGETIGTANLSNGDYVSGVGCDYTFTVEDVPDAKFYRIEVSHRGEVEYSFRQMEATDWA
jgi:hypothetical protein